MLNGVLDGVLMGMLNGVLNGVEASRVNDFVGIHELWITRGC